MHSNINASGLQRFQVSAKRPGMNRAQAKLIHNVFFQLVESLPESNPLENLKNLMLTYELFVTRHVRDAFPVNRYTLPFHSGHYRLKSGLRQGVAKLWFLLVKTRGRSENEKSCDRSSRSFNNKSTSNYRRRSVRHPPQIRSSTAADGSGTPTVIVNSLNVAPISWPPSTTRF